LIPLPRSSFITQPNSVDIADLEGWQAKLAAQAWGDPGHRSQKIKEFDTFFHFHQGRARRHKIPRQGISPYEALYIEKPDSTEFATMASPSG